MKKILTAVIIIAALTSVQIVNAQPGRFDGPPSGFRAKLMEDLHLTDNQLTEINALKTENQKAMIDLSAELKKNMLELKSLIQTDDFSESDVKSIMDKNSSLRDEMRNSRIEQWFAIYNLLDDSQKNIWKKSFAGLGFGKFNQSKGGNRRNFPGRRKHGCRGGW